MAEKITKIATNWCVPTCRFGNYLANIGCSHTHASDLPVSPSTAANQRYPDKAQLKETILVLREAGRSYRHIARDMGLHWTRVGQVIKSTETS
jgi:hypothetical protein